MEARRDHGRAEGGGLIRREAEGASHRCNAFCEGEQFRSFRSRLVAQEVDGVGEAGGLINGHSKRGLELSQAVAGVLCGDAPSGCNLCRKLSEFQQVVICNARLTGRRRDISQSFGGDGDAERHLTKVIAHLLKCFGRVEVDNLPDVSHLLLEADGRLDGCRQAVEQSIPGPNGIHHLAAHLVECRSVTRRSRLQLFDGGRRKSSGCGKPVEQRYNQL